MGLLFITFMSQGLLAARAMKNPKSEE